MVKCVLHTGEESGPVKTNSHVTVARRVARMRILTVTHYFHLQKKCAFTCIDETPEAYFAMMYTALKEIRDLVVRF